MKNLALPFAVAIALHAVPAHAGGVGAGTVISNTAQATYETPGGAQSVASNTVDLPVDELLNTTITSLEAGAIGTEPGSTTLTFELTNTGNGPEAFHLTANPAVAGNDFDTTVESIAVDTNGNGIFDPGVDVILTGPETTAELAQDATLTIFVTVTVPTTVTDGEKSAVELKADAVTGTGTPGTVFNGAGVGGVDAIGDATSADNSADGNVVITFTQAVDTITIVYGNANTAPANPDGQAMQIHDITFCNPFADISVTKVSSVASDSVNGVSDPMAIPGALIQYLIAVTNTGVSATDGDSVVISDDGPANAKLCFDTLGSGMPVVFTDGSPVSGLGLVYIAPGSVSDDVEFSNDQGVTWNYSPVLDADGCDQNVTDFRLLPSGQLNAGAGFTLQTSYRVR